MELSSSPPPRQPPRIGWPSGASAPAVQTGKLLFLSGMLSTSGNTATAVGVVGKDRDVKAGREAAYTAALNVLARLKALLVKKGVQLFAQIDHAAQAKKVGLLRPSKPWTRAWRPYPPTQHLL